VLRLKFHKDSKKKTSEKTLKGKISKLPALDIPFKKGLQKKRKLRIWRILGIIFFVIIALALINYRTTLQYALDAKDYLSGVFGVHKGETIAKVNGVPITESDFEKQYDLFFFMRGLPTTYKVLVDKNMVLEQVINEELLLQEAQKNGISVSDQSVNAVLKAAINNSAFTEETLISILQSRNLSMNDLKEYYRRNIIIIALLNKTIESKVNITEFDTTMFYNESISRYTAKPGEIRLRQIVVNSSSEAEAIMNDLKEGVDFVDLAHTYSIDADSASYGGDLGFVNRTGIEEKEGKNVADAAFSLKIEETSALIKSDDKYYILRREANIISYEELEPVIRQGLENAMRNTLITEYMANLRAKAKIEYFSWAAPENATEAGTGINETTQTNETAAINSTSVP